MPFPPALNRKRVDQWIPTAARDAYDAPGFRIVITVSAECPRQREMSPPTSVQVAMLDRRRSILQCDRNATRELPPKCPQSRAQKETKHGVQVFRLRREGSGGVYRASFVDRSAGELTDYTYRIKLSPISNGGRTGVFCYRERRNSESRSAACGRSFRSICLGRFREGTEPIACTDVLIT